MTENANTLAYRCPHCHALVEVESDAIDETVTCTECQRPFRAVAPRSAPAGKVAKGDQERAQRRPTADVTDDERVLQTAHPSMFRNHPFRYLGIISLLILGLAGLGIRFAQANGLDVNFGNWREEPWIENPVWFWSSIALVAISIVAMFAWWVETRFSSLRVTNQRSVLQSGLIARETSEVRHDDVRNMQIDQSVFQRVLGVGTIAISSSGQDDFEIVAKGMPHPELLAKTIREYQ